MAEVPKQDRLFAEVVEALAKHQPELIAKLDHDCIRVTGFFICSGSMGEFDRYEIECVIPWTYPQKEPFVRELGGRFPPTVGYHVFPANEQCCLGHWDLWRLKNADAGIELYFRDYLHSYFIGQHIRESGEDWPFGEEGHSKEEITAAYLDAFDLPTGSDREAFVNLICGPLLQSNPLCPCGSGEYFKKCHRQFVKDLRKQIAPDLRKRIRKRVATPVGRKQSL